MLVKEGQRGTMGAVAVVGRPARPVRPASRSGRAEGARVVEPTPQPGAPDSPVPAAEGTVPAWTPPSWDEIVFGTRRKKQE